MVIFSQYPQYSCSTSGSSFNAIYSYFKNKNKMPKDVEWSVIDRWSTNSLLIKTFASNIKEELKHFPENIRNDVLILFSAHSLPLKVTTNISSFLILILEFVLLPSARKFLNRLYHVEIHIHRKLERLFI